MEDVSLSLYHYMCKNIVGTENHVKTIRLMNTVCDNLSSDYRKVHITSGSFGEGLEMRGSDIDIMYVLTFIEVHDKIKSIVFSPIKTYFVLTTEDTKAGFTMLRLIRSQDPTMLKSCEKFRQDFYLSNALFKQLYLTDCCPVEHGPCVSDKEGYSDFAYCLHSKSWIQPASRWIMRSGQGYGLLTFPKDPDRRKIWIQKVKRQNFVPTEHSRLCAKHFDFDQFVIDARIASSVKFTPKQKRLKANAIPTIFNYNKSGGETSALGASPSKRKRIRHAFHL
ncbi:THAP2 [Mytilus coruscus]|uniref:THAP2 n=1 Tax=Mytilus coruscus TaxID=42192 RepID=A0A6J8AA75_MYTCO|nr:THAP2 [Mytilus coruscus]